MSVFRLPVISILAAALLAATGFAGAADAPAATPRKIVLIAGKKSHGPEGNRIHDYPWSVRLLKVMLDNSNVADRVKVEFHLDGWPKDATTLDDADTIMVISDGRDGDKYEEAPHLQSAERIAMIEKQVKRGCGFLTFHFSTFAPDQYAKETLRWTGGYFDWETDGKRLWYSAIRTLEGDVQLGQKDHAVLRGVKPFRMKEEFYYNIRFDREDKGLEQLLVVPDLKGREPDGNIVAWARQRTKEEGGGRGFGTTCGHFYDNWKNDDFRKLILNAIVWTADAEVPKEGVEAKYYEHEAITSALNGITGTERAIIKAEAGAKGDDKPILALILTGHDGPFHPWKPKTSVLQKALEQDDRFKVSISTDIEDLSKLKPGDYDVLVLNYCNYKLPVPLSDASKKAFVEYLKSGGGLTIVHFSNGAWHSSLPGAEETDWPEFRKICRRVWDHKAGSEHDNFRKFKVDITDLKHEITQGMKSWETMDELYFNQAGDEPIEPLITAVSQKRGKAEPLAWAYAYGKGRVFQTLLGHNELSLAAGGTAELVRRGSVWAASREQRPIERQDINPKDTAPPRTPPQKNEPGAKILPPDPGLDGGKGGHWGEKNDKDWVDTRLDKMQFGPMVSHTFETAGHRANKGIALRVGESQEAAVLLDAQTGALVAGWTGDFLKFDPARFGLIGRHKIAGKLEWELGDQLCFRGARKVQYRGLHRDGNRVIFEYDVDGVRVLDSPWAYTAGGVTAFTRDMELGAGFGDAHIVLNDGKCYSSFHTDQPTGGIKIAWSDDRKRMEFSMAKRDTPLRVRLYFIAMKHGQLNTFPARDAAREERIYDFDRLAKGGAPLWGKPIEVKGHVNDRDKPYVIDTIPVPYDNPFGALMFLSGIDFFDNGDAAVSTVHGDVWLVRGLDRTLAKVTWQRFATGLYQPLGVRIVNNKVHVLGRDQITILHDRNDDGEADFYENFSSTIHTSAGGHDYVTSLEVDREGNFYYVDPRGVHRISTDGKTNDTLATGFRNPNGLSVGPDGTITVAPQEGDWTPASMICQFSPAPESGSASASAKGTPYFGYGGPRVTPDRPLGYDPPLVYLPRLVDNSSGSQVWVTSDKWGPLKGQLLNLSFGRSSMQLILREEIDGVFNGAVVPLPHRFLSGVMRGAFHPKDGQLYVVGMNGWVTNAARDGCLQRVRYTGKQPALPIAFETRPTDLRITFSQPLDKELAEDVDGYAAEQWNYRYSSAYGSKDYSVANPNVEGHDAVKVKSVKLEADGKTIVLDLGELKSVHQLRLRYDLDTAAGEGLRGEIVFTINRVTE